MLHSLHIANVALIDEIDIGFTPGLNILSGETGAGKSVIIGSVSIALGGKLPKDILKDPQKSGFIELGFTLDRMDDSFVSLLEEKQIDVPEDGELLISRKITGTKSVCRINGETISASDLRDITDRLLDLHGQHEHQSLLKKAKHLEILDENGQPLLAEDEDRRYFEGPWMHKYNGLYYLSYSTGTTHYLVYATSENPDGPFTYRGRIMEPVIGWTTHHSIVEYKGKWYLFYHDCELSNGINHRRCVKYTELKYNEDGTIQTIKPYEF